MILVIYCFMSERADPVNESVIIGLSDRITYHAINSCFGGICIVFNIILLGIFLGHGPFRSRYVLLIQLCVGDLIYSISVVLAGLHQIRLYSTIFQTLTLPVRTTMECALEPWLILRIVGDLLIPVTTLWMGIERFTAILFPLFYRFSIDGKAVKLFFLPVLSSLFVFTSLLVAFCIAYPDYPTYYYCGRKAAFGDGFGVFVYVSNVLCNVLSTVLSAAAYWRASNMAKSQSCIKRQVATIRYYLLISVLSTLLVSLPNTIALFQVYVKAVSDAISKPSVWMQTINSGIHLFVYLTLNREFRIRAFTLLRIEVNDRLSLMKPSIVDAIEAPLRGCEKRSDL